MFKGNRNLAVGLFITVALATVAGFSMWLAGSKGSQPMAHYSLLFDHDVAGLSLGGPVYYLGVNVGRVSSMNLIPGEQIKVRVDISVLKSTPVDAGTYASLAAQGITGVTVISLAGEPGDHGPLPATPGFDKPLIPVRQSGLSALLSQAPDTILKINRALDQVNDLLGETNRAEVSSLLANLNSLSAALSQERDSLASLPGQMSDLLTEAQATVATLHQAVDSVQPGLADTLQHVNEVSVNLAALSLRLDTWMSENDTQLQHFIDNGLGQTPELMYDMRRALRQMQKLLKQLQHDPSQLILRSPNDTLEVDP